MKSSEFADLLDAQARANPSSPRQMAIGPVITGLQRAAQALTVPRIVGENCARCGGPLTTGRECANHCGDKIVEQILDGVAKTPESQSHDSHIRFTIPGDPVGFIEAPRNRFKCGAALRLRVEKYYAYCHQVRLYAKMAGLDVPMIATREHQIMVSTVAYFRNGVHADPENINAGIRDALFYSKGRKGKGDQQTGGYFPPPLYDAVNPRVEITIEKWVK